MAMLVYMTAPTDEEARTIGHTLVAERLAACVNILGAAQSIFRWNGSVQNEQEVAFIAKTTEDRVEALIAKVKAMHSYDVPCIIALPIVTGSSDFLNWIAAETTA